MIGFFLLFSEMIKCFYKMSTCKTNLKIEKNLKESYINIIKDSQGNNYYLNDIHEKKQEQKKGKEIYEKSEKILVVLKEQLEVQNLEKLNLESEINSFQEILDELNKEREKNSDLELRNENLEIEVKQSEENVQKVYNELNSKKSSLIDEKYDHFYKLVYLNNNINEE